MVPGICQGSLGGLGRFGGLGEVAISQSVWKSPCTLATSIVLLVRFIQR